MEIEEQTTTMMPRRLLYVELLPGRRMELSTSLLDFDCCEVVVRVQTAYSEGYISCDNVVSEIQRLFTEVQMFDKGTIAIFFLFVVHDD